MCNPLSLLGNDFVKISRTKTSVKADGKWISFSAYFFGPDDVGDMFLLNVG
jgi:hypothetical protein